MNCATKIPNTHHEAKNRYFTNLMKSKIIQRHLQEKIQIGGKRKKNFFFFDDNDKRRDFTHGE